RFRPSVVAGRWLDAHEADAVVLNQVTAAQLGFRVGDRLNLPVDFQTTVGRAGTRQITVTIVGLTHAVDYLAGSADPQATLGEAFMTQEALNRAQNKPSDFADRLVVHAVDASPQALRTLQSRIKTLLDSDGLAQANVRTIQELTQGEVDTMPTIYILFA